MPFRHFNFQSQDFAYLQTAMNIPVLSRNNEYDLICDWQQTANSESLNTLINAHSKLVISITIRFKHYGLPFLDCVQEGHLGLLEAIQRFDPERDLRFSSYARWWILAAVQDYILRNWSIVRTGSTSAHKALFFKLNHLKQELKTLSDTLMETEQRETIADLLHVTVHDVETMETRLLHHDYSLNLTFADKREELGGLLKDERPTPEECSLTKHATMEQKAWIDYGLKTLNPREMYIIVKHRLSEPPETLDMISEHLGITKERVRQLEGRAMRKIKHTLARNLSDVQATFH